MARSAFVNVSNPAAFGVEWTTNGNRYQLVNPRGTTSLMFGAHNGTNWFATRVVAPERFLTDAPKTFKEFHTVAEKYVDQD